MSRLFKIRLIIIAIAAVIAACSGAQQCVAQSQTPEVQYKLAAGFYERGQWEEASQALGDFITQYPNVAQTPDASFFLAETLMQQHLFKAAYIHYQQFLTQFAAHPLAVRATFRMGESAFRDNNTKVAIRMLEEFSRKYPQHELNQYAFSYLGQLRLVKSEPQLAQRAFERSLHDYPNGAMSVESRLGLGNAMMKQGYIKEAKRLFEYCVTQNENRPMIADEAKLQLGLVALYQQPIDHAEAQKWFSMVAENATDAKTRATAILSWARSIGETDPNAAFDLLEPVIGWELPTSIKVDLLIESAIAASRTERTELAIGWLQQVRTTKPLNKKILDAVRFEMRLLETQDKVPAAIELAEEFNLEVEKRTIIAKTQEAIGREQYNNGDFEGSRETFGLLLSLQNTGAQQQMTWRYFEALSYIGLKNLKQAENSLGRISDDFSDEKLKSLVQFCKASVKFRLEKYSAAIPYFQKYLSYDLDPGDRRNAKQELAICFTKTGNFVEADLILDSVVSKVNANVIDSSDELESIIELIAEATKDNQKQAIANKWYAYLKDNSQDTDRRNRASRWFLIRNLEVPIEQQTVVSFKKLFAEHPQDALLVTTAIENAKRFEANNDAANAIGWYQLALENSPADNRQLNGGMQLKIANLASKQSGLANLTIAKSNLEAWLASETNDAMLKAEVLFRLAWVYRDLGDSAKSLSNFVQLVNNHIDSKYWPDAAYRIAKQNVTTKNYSGAKELIAKILAVYDLPEAIKSRTHFLAGKVAFAEQDWPNVETAMQAFLATASNDNTKLTAKYFMAEAIFQQQKNARAIKAFDELHLRVDSLPNEYQPWVFLRKASLELLVGDATTAAKLATEGKQRFKDFTSLYEFDFLIARGLESEGLLSDARQHFEKVIASPNGSKTAAAAHSQWRIGETYFHQEKYKLAIAEYYKVDSLYSYPNWRAAALIQAGKCQEHLANPKNAVKLYRQLLDRYPSSEFAVEAQGRLAQISDAATQTANRKPQRTH